VDVSAWEPVRRALEGSYQDDAGQEAPTLAASP
jgi:hypothetical protein